MPYQDLDDDDVTTAIPRAPSLVERFVQKVLLEDWGLKLLAIGITVVLWFAVTGQNQPITQRSTVQLSFLRPEGMDISNDQPANVEVTLRGSPSKLDQVGPRLLATIDISDHKAGERVVRLLDRAQLPLPSGVTILGFRPTTVPIRLEPVIETLADVDVKFEGSLPEGYEVFRVRVDPARVRLRGPADRVKAIQKVTTESISLDGKKESFSLSNVAITLSDSKIEILDTGVNIHVEIGEKKRSEVFRFASAGSFLVASLLFRLPIGSR